jgi:ABC-type polysaccharide/polyol phosphate export permease
MWPALLESATNLRDIDRWAKLAWIDTTLRYRRTVLGPWWVTLSTGTLIGSVGLVWGAIFNIDLAIYMPYFAIGIILWTLISGALTDGCNVFTLAARLIKSVPTPLIVHVHRMLARQIIILAHNALLIFFLWVIFQWPVTWSALLAIPGLLIVTFALSGGVLAFGILCTRFRDVPQIIAAILQLLFLVTPIMWTASSLHGKSVSILLDINPFYYLIEIVRGPLLGQPPDVYVWIAASIFSLTSFLIGHALYGHFRHRVAYWL